MGQATSAVYFLVAWAACGNAPTAQQPRPNGPPTLTFAAPAARYNDATESPPSSPLSELVFAQVSDAAIRAGRRPPVPDERLFFVSSALATVVTEEGNVGYPMVEFSLQANGVIEPSPHLLVAWGSLDGEIAKTLRPRIDEIFRRGEVALVGLGAVIRGQGDYGALVLTLLPSRVHTSPIPRALPERSVADFEFALGPGLRHPSVLVTRLDGMVEEIEAQSSGSDAFSVHLDCGEGSGKMQVELVAGSEGGGDSVAKFPIWCGVEPPRTITIPRPVKDLPADPSKAERAILDLINGERTKLGRAPLKWDESLAKIARENSKDMRRTGVVATRVPYGLSIRQRVRVTRSDLDVTAGVAHAYGIAETENGMMDLPSTRRALISDVATIIGVGVVYSEPVGGLRGLYMTQIVAKPRAQ